MNWVSVYIFLAVINLYILLLATRVAAAHRYNHNEVAARQMAKLMIIAFIFAIIFGSLAAGLS